MYISGPSLISDHEEKRALSPISDCCADVKGHPARRLDYIG